ncbi:MAG: NERD domain-containing protein [Anaerolineae bacterium]|nr:NERD domain-containing protein [Anaerolineae bacterium]NUQ02769.1 NERD domain-containing protein [Anaerolineae bacterium]
MRVETNDRLVRRNRQIAQYLFFATFAILIGGLFVINQQAIDSEGNFALVAVLQALVLPVAFISTIVSVRMTNLWVRVPRPEVLIRDGLKGLSNRSVLYNYYHFPARHVLICPQGVFVFVTRFQDGRFEVVDDKWRSRRSLPMRIVGLLRFDGIGDPTADAQRAVEHVKKLLAGVAPDVEVHPVIIFHDPRASVKVTGSSVPVRVAEVEQKGDKKVTVLRLRDLFKQPGASGKDPLTPEQITAFEEATLRR